MNEHKIEDVVRAKINELKTLRDQVRVDIHLAGMELRDEWHAIERRMPELDVALDKLRGTAADSIDRITAEMRAFRERVQQAGDKR